MKNIFKFIILPLLAAVAIIACADDADRDWTTPEASFKLNDTTLGANVLYATMANNPFVLSWESQGGAPYTVVVSSTEDFASKVELGKSDTNIYRTTIGTLNTAMLQAGVNPYKAQKVYVRVESASGNSNAISFDVTPYPVKKPIITAPTAGSTMILAVDKAAENLPKFTWSDYQSYGVDVVYTLSIAKKGSTAFQIVGTSTNIKELALTQTQLNDAVLKLGGIPGTAAEYDLKVGASTKSTGGIIDLVSDVVSVKITPFESNVFLYLIGDATAAGWDNAANNDLMYPLLNSRVTPTVYTYTGFFKAGGFKLIKTRGSWDNQYGLGDAAGQVSASGGSGNIPVPKDGYYKLTLNVSALTYTLVEVVPPATTFPTVGIIGDATPNSWDSSTPMTKSATDNHLWVISNVILKDGELKFRANNSWDVNWGTKSELFGTATPGGDNIPVKAGTYTIYFNDFTGAYVFVKK